jgi:glycine oxidase
MSDCLIVGGGVIGLSLAYELAGQGLRVRLIDSGRPGQQASWAGAGILPPASAAAGDALEQLTALSNDLHRRWSEELRASTSIDNGYRHCGAVYLARSAAEAASLQRFASQASAHNIVAQRLSPAALDEIEPALRPSGAVEAAYWVPAECQLRNPRHLKALVAGCLNRGVEITEGAAAIDFEIRGGRVRSVQTALGLMPVDRVCVTAGSWTGALAAKLGIEPAIVPIRGQMVLLSLASPILSRIVNEGSRYLVPRADGRLLVGSTEEHVGFDRSTTSEAIAGLLEFAVSLVPDLATAPIERSWAGLRPSTRDARPYLGRVPNLENAFVAAGHFRSGLQLSTGTAVVMSQLIRGLELQIDLSPFCLDRDLAQRAPAEAAATPPAPKRAGRKVRA